jgi:hypothetical protein
MAKEPSRLPRKAVEEAGWHAGWWAIRGEKILDWCRDEMHKQWRKYVVPAVMALISIVYSWWKSLPLPVTVMIALAVAVIVLVIWEAFTKQRNSVGNKSTEPPAPLINAPPLGQTRPVPKTVHEIWFDYIPRSPLENGWKLDGQEPAFSRPARAPIQNSLKITATVRYHMDYELSTELTSCDLVRFAIRFDGGQYPQEDATMVFTILDLVPSDKSTSKRRRIKYELGSGAPHPTDGKWKKDEWTLPMDAQELPSGWRQFDISLKEAVRKTWGTQGWEFGALRAIRLRGSLSITPIELYETMT